MIPNIILKTKSKDTPLAQSEQLDLDTFQALVICTFNTNRLPSRALFPVFFP